MLEFRKFYGDYLEKSDKKREKKKKSRLRLKMKKDRIITEAKSVPCCDCGANLPPKELEFDHLRDKLFDIGGSRSRRNIGINKLLNEIAKCEVVCTSCHIERERGRGRIK